MIVCRLLVCCWRVLMKVKMLVLLVKLVCRVSVLVWCSLFSVGCLLW